MPADGTGGGAEQRVEAQQGPRPASLLVRLVGGRWTLVEHGRLATDGHRYHDLPDGIEGVSAKVLTDTLRRAERDGLI